MKNLTESQKNLIESLEIEFNKINSGKSKGFKLIDKNEFDNSLDIENQIIENAKQKEKIILEQICDLRSKDIEALNNDLDDMGLIASINISSCYYSVRIDIKGEEITKILPDLKFTYRMASKSSFRQSFFDAYIGISTYLTPDKETYFENIETLVQNELFKRAIMLKYQIAKQRGLTHV